MWLFLHILLSLPSHTPPEPIRVAYPVVVWTLALIAFEISIQYSQTPQFLRHLGEHKYLGVPAPRNQISRATVMTHCWLVAGCQTLPDERGIYLPRCLRTVASDCTVHARNWPRFGELQATCSTFMCHFVLAWLPGPLTMLMVKGPGLVLAGTITVYNEGEKSKHFSYCTWQHVSLN